MQTAVIILTYVVMAAALTIGVLISDRRGLKKSLAHARTARDEAWKRIQDLHQERIDDLERHTARINDMTERFRHLNSSYSAINED